MLLHVLSCSFSLPVFIRETSSSSFVRNCKLQQVQMFGRSKNLLILQSCSGNTFMIVTTLSNVLDSTIKMINYIKSGSFNT